MRPLFLLLIIFISVCSYGQESRGHSKQFYLEKSKKQKRISLVTGGTGTVLLAVGTIMYLSEYRKETGINASRLRTGESLILGGAGLALISVPFRLAAQQNSHLAGTVSLIAQPDPLNQQKMLAQFHRSFAIRIQFSR
jgi:hypothetical protein